MDVLDLIKPFAALLVAKLPILGVIAANGVAAMVAVGLLIEIVEAVAAVTANKKDDAVAAKIKVIKDKVLMVLEIIPHMNIPVVAAIVSASKALAKALAIVKAMIAAAKDK